MLIAVVLLFAPMPVAESYSWHKFNDNSGHYSLRRNGVQVGCYQPETGLYFPLDQGTGTFGSACKPPVDPPLLNFGLIEEPRPARNRFRTATGEISAEEALAALRRDPTPDVPDDGSRPRLLVIGPKDQCAAVERAWGSDSALSPWRDKVTFQTMQPADWRLQGVGYVTSGTPTIYYLAANGEVLHRQDDFNGGAAELAEALREADAAYNPVLDRDRRSAWRGLYVTVKQIPPSVWLLVAAVAAGCVLLLLRKGN